MNQSSAKPVASARGVSQLFTLHVQGIGVHVLSVIRGLFPDLKTVKKSKEEEVTTAVGGGMTFQQVSL